MEEIIFSSKSKFRVKLSIFFRKFKTALLLVLRICTKPFRALFYAFKLLANKIYLVVYPHRFKFLKGSKIVLILSVVLSTVSIIFIYIFQHRISIIGIVTIPIEIVVYVLLRFMIWTYQFFVGKYQNCEIDRKYTYTYITKHMDKLNKIFGGTGKGKDTFQSGCISMLRNHFIDKTNEDMRRIEKICYFVDFDLLQFDLQNNYEDYLTFSKKKIEASFLGDSVNVGLAPARNMYIISYYRKSKKIVPEDYIQDYKNFMQDPISYPSSFVVGTGVNRRHYLQLIMEEYIQWWIRLYVEKNFILTNQPFLEDINTGLKAKQFSMNMIRTKSKVEKVINNRTKQKEEREEKVFFPWKDRLILSETECGSWWNNRDTAVLSEMISSGIRDFKAYQRHFMKDFYWFQVDQASDRTNKLFRELEHSYVLICSRTLIPGGEFQNRILNWKLDRCKKKIAKIEIKTNCSSIKKMEKQQKLEDLKNLYAASSKTKYKSKAKRIENRFKERPLPGKYFDLQTMVSEYQIMIDNNIHDAGYIKQTVIISKNSEPSLSTPETNIRNIIQKLECGEDVPITFKTTFTFKANDCERYDTRYMRNLAEERSKESCIEFKDVPLWPDDFTMGKKEIEWMSYIAAAEQFGISKKAYIDLRFGEKYKEHIKK